MIFVLKSRAQLTLRRFGFALHMRCSAFEAQQHIRNPKRPGTQYNINYVLPKFNAVRSSQMWKQGTRKSPENGSRYYSFQSL